MNDKLSGLAEEYKVTVKTIEQRIDELSRELRRTESLELRFKLKSRINALYKSRNECLRTAHEIEYYYKEETAYVPKQTKPARKQRVKFSRDGYGCPTPAAAMGSGKARSCTVSGLGAVLLGTAATGQSGGSA